MGMTELPEAAPAAGPVVSGLEPSPALSILANPAGSFRGRKLGVLLGDGFDAAHLADVLEAAEAENVDVELIAALVGGAAGSDGTLVEADQMLDGAPSVLYDAVVLLIADGDSDLASRPTARDFVADAFAHCKFIGHTAGAAALFEAAGVAGRMDGGFVDLDGGAGASDLIGRAAALRFWDRHRAIRPDLALR
jgi:catalase